MGCRFSCSSSTLQLNCIRIVHINGSVKDFAAPLTVSKVTAKHPRHVLCSSAQLLYVGSRPLPPEQQLEPGRIYFLLPHSVFHSVELSPVDFASLAKRLTAAAKRAGPAADLAGEAGLLSVKESPEKPIKIKKWKPVLETIEELPMSWSQRGLKA